MIDPWLPENTTLIKALLDHGADPEAATLQSNASPYAPFPPVALAAAQGKHRTVSLLLDYTPVMHRQRDIQRAFRCAAQTGHVDIMLDMLNRGADINEGKQTGFTAMFEAIVAERDNVVKTLLEHGADITKHTTLTSIRNRRAYPRASYLQHALECEQLHPKDEEPKRIVALLKQAGAKE